MRAVARRLDSGCSVSSSNPNPDRTCLVIGTESTPCVICNSTHWDGKIAPRTLEGLVCCTATHSSPCNIPRNFWIQGIANALRWRSTANGVFVCYRAVISEILGYHSWHSYSADGSHSHKFVLRYDIHSVPRHTELALHLILLIQPPWIRDFP